MKQIIIIAFGLFIGINATAQKAKIKTELVGFKYNLYPEIDGYDDFLKYNVTIKDRNGVNYSYSEGMGKSQVDVVIPNSWINGLNFNNQGNTLLIQVEQVAHTNENKEVANYSDNSIPNAPVTRYYYKITADEIYKIKIIDVAKENKVLKEFEFKTTPTITWPFVPSGSNGLKSPELLATNYTKNSESEAGFIKKVESEFIKSSLASKEVKSPIEMSIRTQWKKINYWVTSVKTKETTNFQLLDSAEIYLKAAVDLVEENNKNNKKGNFFVGNAKQLVLKAHSIYLKYNTEEYINWFTDAELKDEYTTGIINSLYLTAVLTGDFQLADQVRNTMMENAKTSKNAQKVYDLNMNDEPNSNSNVSRLNAAAGISTSTEVFNLRYIHVREQKYYEIFKARYGF